MTNEKDQISYFLMANVLSFSLPAKKKQVLSPAGWSGRREHFLNLQAELMLSSRLRSISRGGGVSAPFKQPYMILQWMSDHPLWVDVFFILATCHVYSYVAISETCETNDTYFASQKQKYGHGT